MAVPIDCHADETNRLMRPTLVFPANLDIPPTSADRSIVLIGRHPQCDVVLPLGSVSRRHCVLVESDDELVIRDLGSRHGVWVNGRRVEESSLNVGDELAIGPVIVRVVDPGRYAANDVREDSEEVTETSTEISDLRPSASNSPRVEDSGLMVTEPIRPPESDLQVRTGEAEKTRLSLRNVPDDSDDDDIPSDSKLEEVI